MQARDDAPSAEAAASGSSFYLALRILPREQRLAMFAIYDFCRAVDDIADGDQPRPQRHAALEAWRSEIDALYDGAPPPHLSTLAEAVRRFGLERADFHAVIDGMMMDVEADLRAPDWATLDLYCDRVASAAGRLSVRVFGMPQGDGLELAYHLGRALQLSNILRDIDEDAGMGRLYLPREELARAGLLDRPIAAILADPRLAGVCETVAERARAHFAEAERIMDASPRAAVRTPRLMAAAYQPLLEQLAERGWTAPRNRISRPKLPLARAVLFYGIL
ncbi:presqualene diphosphate synthase HpnD [Jiella sp. M17.18]|uniref:presqualene diphosphate synthase HpnD n=1 Tax=Jiella sp. M17.18 TaxID=3234247 RepID=UPI0034DF7A35